jgi:curli biogenesis system outer membrane secretion channel CsgG
MRCSKSVAYLTMAILLGGCAKSGQPQGNAGASAVAPTTAAVAPVASLPDVGNLEQVRVTTQGSGPTAGVAVQEAMKLAILEVNGATIDSSAIAVKFGLDVADGQDAVMLRGSAFAEAIAQRSKGTISGFKLITMTKPSQSGGPYKATIEASIAKFRAPEDAKKIKIVIAPLRFSANSFAMGAQHLPAAKVAEEIHQRLIDALTATGRFSVLDRDFGAEAQSELDLVAAGQTPSAEMAKLSQTLSADIVWVGTLNDFAYVRNARKLATSDRELVSYSGGWSVSQRILNVSTRQIMLSNTLQDRAPSIDATTLDRGIDVSQTEGNMESAIVNQSLATILSRTFPVTVVAKNGFNVVLSQGGRSVKEGARYAVVLMGKEIMDPQTQQSLGRIESACCEVVIDRVAANLSYGHLENVKGSLDEVMPAALQIREELKSVKPAAVEGLAAKRPGPQSVNAQGNASVPPVTPVGPPDEGKKW